MTVSNAVVKLRNLDDLPFLHFTRLNQDVIKGTDVQVELESLPVLSSGRYFALIGFEGNQDSEILAFEQSTIVDNRVITCSPKFNHKANEPVKITKVYKAKLYQADTEDGTYSEVTTRELDALPPDGIVFTIPTLDQSKWFKIIYIARMNSTDAEVTELSDTKAFQIQGLSVFNYYDADPESVTAIAGAQYQNEDSKRIWECIWLAQGQVESALEFAGYSVPLDPLTEEVKSWVKNLAAAHLCRINGDLDGYERLAMIIMNTLEQVRNGKYLPAPPASPSDGGGIRYYPDASAVRFAKINQKW
jgi:hypothetical protein